jgi:CDP-glycerol glycerophosphotransferase
VSVVVRVHADDGDGSLVAYLTGLRTASYLVREVRVVRAGAEDPDSPPDTDPWVEAGALARGDRVLFLEAGDVPASGALEAMSAALDRSGSDVAVPAVAPGRGGPRRRAPWAAGVAAATGVSLTQVPAVVVDPSPAGKLFRAGLWREVAAAGPAPAEVVSLRALAAAPGLDLLPEVVIERHDRQATRPVTKQDRFRVEGLEARVATWRAVTAELATAPREVREEWLLGLLTEHVWPACHDAVAAGEAFATVLAEAVHEVLAGMPPGLLAAVPLDARLAAVAAGEATWAELALVLDHLADHPHGLPTEAGSGGRVVAALPEGVPAAAGYLTEEVRAVRDVDRVLRSRVRLHPTGEGVEVVGAAFVDYDPDALPELRLVAPDGAATPVVPERRVDPTLDDWAARGHEDRTGSGFRAVLAHAGPLDGRPWTVVVSMAGRVERHQARPVLPPEADVVVDRLEAAGDTLVVGMGTHGPPQPATARLVGGRAATEAATVSGEGRRRVEVALPLRHDLFGVPALLPAGGYTLDLRADDGSALSLAATPGVTEVVTDRLRVEARPAPAGVRLVVGAPLDAAARSAFGQRRMREEDYPAARRAARSRTVLLESFRGGSVGDNPGAVGRALAERSAAAGLHLDLAYVVDDPSVVVPDGARAVVRRTAAWYEALGSAAAYVSNAGAPYWFVKAPGQLHVQTWHGTPLKRIGEHRGAGDFATWRHRRRLAAQASGWDAMVSSGGYVSEIYRGAFGFTGRVLEVGYPRNDVLLSVEADVLRERVRARLGLQPHDRAVLYAPTWREYVGVRDPKPLYLDAEQLTSALPDAVVLVRGHYNSLRQDDLFVGRDRIRDVTRYPDIADLFLAADALVTDYSSVMFDFALTDRPQVLLVPDLERYRDVERGFYLDLERQRPGPLVRTTAEVADVLAGPDRHADERAAFRRDFCPFEDGRASARVADFVLERLGSVG